MKDGVSMNCKIDEVKTKPDDWPANAIECQLENIQTQVEKLKKILIIKIKKF